MNQLIIYCIHAQKTYTYTLLHLLHISVHTVMYSEYTQTHIHMHTDCFVCLVVFILDGLTGRTLYILITPVAFLLLI